MSKLISRNPVLRFKLGRKILFVKPGDKMLYNGNEEVTEEILNGQTIYRRKNGTYIYPNSKLLSPIKSSTPIDYSFMKGGTRLRTPEELKKWKAEVQRQKNIQDNILRKKIITPTKKTVVANKVLPKYSGVDLQGKTVGEWQKILKDYYAPGTKKKYMEDGIWGDATDDAYRRYLTIANTDFTPVSKEPIAIPNNENNNVNFDYEKFKRAALASDYTPDSVEQKLVTTPITYNRSMTRDWLRNNIGTAYGVSGTMRAAARRKLNGLATDNDITLIKSNLKLYDALKNAGLFKQGGQLPSRNPVKRFKNRINKN